MKLLCCARRTAHDFYRTMTMMRLRPGLRRGESHRRVSSRRGYHSIWPGSAPQIKEGIDLHALGGIVDLP